MTTLSLPDKTKATGEVALVSTAKKPKYNTKKSSMIKLFIRLGERGLNCFEAANSHNDYVLRTTVSDIQRDYGLLFSRKYEQVPNAFGRVTDCMRYWLDDANKAKAITIVGEG